MEMRGSCQLDLMQVVRNHKDTSLVYILLLAFNSKKKRSTRKASQVARCTAESRAEGTKMPSSKRSLAQLHYNHLLFGGHFAVACDVTVLVAVVVFVFLVAPTLT